MSSKTTLVTSARALVSAARKAVAGDTILLAPGHYGDVSLSGMRPAGTVTIRSADPENEAVFSGLRLTRVNNFVIADVDIVNPLNAGERESAVAASINLSNNISLVGVELRGSMNGNHFDDGNGLAVTNSSRIAVLDSSFQQFNNAAVIGNVSDIIFAGNTVREVREGLNLSRIDGGLFERNFLTAISPDASKGDHSDAFQVHSAAGFASNDLVFRSNVILADAQGIFIKSETAARGVFHSNIVVENNFYEGNFRNAISVTHASNVVITDNSVREGEGPGLAPAIVVGAVTNALVADNIAPMITSRPDWASTNVTMANNIDTWDSAQRRGVALDTVFESATVSGAIDFARLDAIGSASVDVSGVGFRAVAGIGDLAGEHSSLLAAYLPQFDQNFAVVQLV
jgi:hypothetical protein